MAGGHVVAGSNPVFPTSVAIALAKETKEKLNRNVGLFFIEVARPGSVSRRGGVSQVRPLAIGMFSRHNASERNRAGSNMAFALVLFFGTICP